jgi:endonuclease G, mitochondrial
MRPIDLKDPGMQASIDRYRQHQAKITKALDPATLGQPEKLELPERIEQFAARERRIIRDEMRQGVRGVKALNVGEERALGETNDLLSIEFFEQGLIAARAVGMLTVAGSEFGTGFLVGRRILMTNHHVIRDPESAESCELELDREDNRFGEAKQSEVFDLEPKRFFLTQPGLDFTLVAVSAQSHNGRPIDAFGFHPIIAQQGKIRISDPVNIVSHPKGGMKCVVVHDSRLLYLEDGGAIDDYCWYSSDTEEGSSGAPVFNNRWEVVALHHRSIPKTNAKGQYVDRNGRAIAKDKADDSNLVWIANEGIRASRLVRAIESAPLDPGYETERGGLLDLWSSAKSGSVGVERFSAADSERQPQHGKPPPADRIAVDIGHAAESAPGGLPIVITIRIGRE